MNKITIYDLDNLGPHKENGIRQLRTPLLEAFDIYKSNVSYGVETETEEERVEIITWYQQLLNLDIEAIKNVPAKVQHYIK